MLISLGKVSVTLILIVLIPLLWLGSTYTGYPLYQKGFRFHPLFFSFVISFGKIIAGGILELVSYFLVQGNKKKITIQEKQTSTLQQFNPQTIPEIKESKGFSYCIFAVLGAIDFIGFALINFTTLQSDSSLFGYQFRPIQIIFTAFLSIKTLKSPLYLHHYVSTIMIIIGIIMIVIDVFLKIDFGYCETLIFLISYLLFSVKDVGEKWLMVRHYYIPCRILVVEGAISLCCLIIAFLIANFIPCRQKWNFCIEDTSVETVSAFFSAIFNSDTVGFCILILIINGSLGVCNIFTNQMLSPTHKAVGDTVSSIIFSLKSLADKPKSFNWPLIGVGYFVILLACFVFNEIVILHFWHLNQNTKEEIIKRSKKEIRLEIDSSLEGSLTGNQDIE